MFWAQEQKPQMFSFAVLFSFPLQQKQASAKANEYFIHKIQYTVHFYPKKKKNPHWTTHELCRKQNLS